VRWGLAGCGDLAERRLVAALSAGGQRLLAVWSRDPERARRFARRHGIARAAHDPADLCRGVEAVYVALPVAAHVPIAAAALRGGCHVLIEKPLSPGLESPAPLLALSRAGRAGQPLAGVAYYRRLHPALRRARALLASGALGAARAAEACFESVFEPGPDDPKRWRTQLAAAGGGVLADAGCHRLDLLCWLLGAPSSVAATLAGFHPGGAERRAEVTLAWENGAGARCACAWGAGSRDRFRVECERGHFELDPLDGGVLRWQGPDGPHEEVHPPPDNPHAELVADFARAAAAGGLPACPLADAILVDRLIEAAARSHRHGGRAVLLAPGAPG
jgi:predicted dehydrogenase